MKKDVNFTLFGIIILLLFSIAGITIYYSLTYQRLNSDYQEAIDDVRRTTDDLNRAAEEIMLKEKELNKTEDDLIHIINELNLSKQQVTSLGGYYTDLKGEKESIEANIDRIKGERDTWKSEYTSAKVDLELWQGRYTNLNRTFSTVNSSLQGFRDMGNDITEYANEGKGYVNDIDDIKISEIKSYISALSNHINSIEQACENGTVEEVEDELDEDKEGIFKAVNDINEIVMELEKILDKIKDRAT